MSSEKESLDYDTLDVEFIEWTDSRGNEGWFDIKDVLSEKSDSLWTVGFVAKETEHWLTLIFTIDAETNQCLGFIQIPKVAIKKRKVIKVGKKNG